MSKFIDDQYKIIREEEKKFSKRVVYIIRALKPQPWWQLFIPFMFLLEYFDRKKDIASFTEKHMLFKEMALSAACWTAASGDPEKSRQEMHSQLREYWMHNQQFESRDLYELLGQMLDLLLEHYLQLLQTMEKDHTLMIRKAYPVRAHYQGFLDKLARLEMKIDQSFVEAMGFSWPDPHIQSKQKAIHEVRKRDLSEIY